MPEETFLSEWDNTYGLSFVDRVMKTKRIFQVSYKSVLYRLSERDGNSVSITEEPDALPPNKFQASMPEVLRSREPESLSSSDFIEDHLSKLVRIAIEKDEISLSRGAEILGLDLNAMRERVSFWE